MWARNVVHRAAESKVPVEVNMHYYDRRHLDHQNATNAPTAEEVSQALFVMICRPDKDVQLAVLVRLVDRGYAQSAVLARRLKKLFTCLARAGKLDIAASAELCRAALHSFDQGGNSCVLVLCVCPRTLGKHILASKCVQPVLFDSFCRILSAANYKPEFYASMYATRLVVAENDSAKAAALEFLQNDGLAKWVKSAEFPDSRLWVQLSSLAHDTFVNKACMLGDLAAFAQRLVPKVAYATDRIREDLLLAGTVLDKL